MPGKAGSAEQAEGLEAELRWPILAAQVLRAYRAVARVAGP